MIDAWPSWPGGCLALVGPAGSGKSHLALAWAASVDASVVPSAHETPAQDLGALRGRPILMEDADQGGADETLFHLINMAGAPGGGLLLTARAPPQVWPTALPDLRSRLNALPLAELSTPDDVVLEGVLRNFFAEKGIRPSDEVIPYLMRRIERSATRARAVVEQIDEASGAEQRAVTRQLVRQILEIDEEGPDLFE